MDRQYEHLFIGDSDYHGFLPNDSGERVDPVAEKGVKFNSGFRIEEGGLKSLEFKI